MYHDGNHSYIAENGGGDLKIQASTGSIFLQKSNGEEMIKATVDGPVELYHDDVKTIETTKTGAIVTGILTATDFSGANATAADFPYGLTGTTASFTGNVSVGGTLTYEDVTNIDSVGIVTARDGLKVLAGGANVVGVVTATSFVGSGAALTGITQTTINSNADNKIITGSGTANTLNAESELTYSTYLNLTRSNSDTNFGDNSAPGGVNGIFIGNSQSTNGVFSAITLAPNDVNGTNQSGSLIAKSVNGGYAPEVHITQRTASNTNESNIKITSARSVELNHQGTKKLHTNTNGIVVSGGAYFNGSTISGTPKLYLYGYAGNDAKGVTIEGSEAALEVVSSADGNHSSSILLRNLNDGFAFINDNDTNKLTLRQFTAVSNDFNAHGTGNGISGLKTLADFNESGSVDLYHNNSLRFATTSSGAQISGNDLTISDTGSVNINLNADSDDSDETHVPTINFKQDNNNLCMKIGVEGNAAQTFTGTTANTPYISAADGHGGGLALDFGAANAIRMKLTSSALRPVSNGGLSLGSTAQRWANVYTNDLNLSNEGSTNSIDNTWGDFTIQEGESDLFLINNRSGKKYKFNLTEVN